MHPVGRACRQILMATVSGLTLAGAVQRAAAQSAISAPQPVAPSPPAANNRVEEVVVTAQKRSESVQKVAATITVLGGKALQRQHIDMAKALASVTTNLSLDINANTVAPYIRGVGTQYANPGLEPSVAVYVDDLYVSRASAGLLSFSDISRVEVLKGPQGTLYGMSDTGGAIRILTKDPTPSFGAGAAVTVGNYGQVGTDDYVTGTILPGLTGRLAVQYDSNDGYVHQRDGGPNLEDRNEIVARGKLFYQPNDRLTIKLMGNYIDKRDHEGQGYLSIYPGLPETTGVAFGGVPSRGNYTVGNNIGAGNTNHLKDRSVELRIDYRTDDVVLSSISGYWQTFFSGYADLDTTTAPLVNAEITGELTDAFSQEFQVVSSNPGPFKYTAGVYYYHENGKEGFGISGLGANQSVPPAAFGFKNGSFLGAVARLDYNSVSPYAQASYRPLSFLEFVAGARFTSLTKNLISNTLFATDISQPLSNTSFPNPILNDPGAAVLGHAPKDSFSSNQFAPKFGVNLYPIDHVLLYASWTRGFKSGGFNQPNPAVGAVPKVQDEELDAIEVGAKTTFGPVQINADYFHYNSKNQQVNITNPTTGLTSVFNAAASTTNGVEAEVNARLTSALTVGGAIAYLDATFDQFPNGPVNRPCAEAPTNPTCVADGGLGLSSEAKNLKGNQLPLAPRSTANVHATYSQPLGDHYGVIDAGLTASFTDAQFFTPDNLYGIPSRWIVNANVGWTSNDGHWAANGFVTNLGDVAYLTQISPFTSTGGWTVPGAPREYGVRLSYTF